MFSRTLYMRIFLAALFCIFIATEAFSGGRSEAAAPATRGQFLAERGIIIPPEEIHIDTYISSINYRYPMPETEIGVSLFNSTSQMRGGQEGILHIGIQGRAQSFENFPPMNLAFVIDASFSMNEQNKISLVKEAAEIVLDRIRDKDYLALIIFNDTARVLFESARMDSPERRQRFLAAVRSIVPQGGVDLEAGLKLGYEQLLANFRQGSVNRLLFFSDGTEFSQRLAREYAHESGDIRVSLIWENRNDLDIHVVTPLGERIFFGNRRDTRGGFLDVDMNVRGESTKPIENIVWPRGRAPYGRYRVFVRNFRYHERERQPTDFQVEIRNGNHHSTFLGTISGTGVASEIEVASFYFRGEADLRREKALVYQMAESFRELGITTSAFGVGTGFDLDLIRNLAEEGGGSSRFIGSREDTLTIFYTEFERTVALIARDLKMELEFMEGVEILETWGYQNRIEGNRIHYRLTGLHAGDYETILVRYRLPPLAGIGERTLARLTVNANDILGNPLPPVEQSFNITFSNYAVDGIACGMVLHSGTMMRFAKTLKEIGRLYYDGRNRQNNLSRLSESLEKTLAIQAELENARLRLDNRDAFRAELEILRRYDEMFRRHIIAAGGQLQEALAVPLPAQSSLSADMEVLQTRVSSLFTEISLSFSEREAPVAALASFALRDGSEPPLVSFLNQSAIVTLAANPRLRLVEREHLDLIRSEQGLQNAELLDTGAAIRLGRLLGARYIITGQVIPMSSQVIVFGRVVNVETAEIVSAAQIFLDRNILGELI